MGLWVADLYHRNGKTFIQHGAFLLRILRSCKSAVAMAGRRNWSLVGHLGAKFKMALLLSIVEGIRLVFLYQRIILLGMETNNLHSGNSQLCPFEMSFSTVSRQWAHRNGSCHEVMALRSLVPVCNNASVE